ncbi:MAG: hypothetical protein ACD_4C00015G0001 [uncultured bacterium (gcode 4)]|uniref:Uncharacterized protein n=1 Tax=uncultured bacterium (gcode 4) TaxID=1234023 RepID=K2F7P7_9BACT|nr:MAG: hypothetical protein ACD_4C00015G0001 [uncultured bacterium (gcode 4)]
MSEKLEQWVKNIDIWSDWKKDWVDFNALKNKLYKDLEYIWNQVQNWKREKKDFDIYANKCKEILEKNWLQLQKITELYKSRRNEEFKITERAKIDLMTAVSKNIFESEKEEPIKNISDQKNTKKLIEKWKSFIKLNAGKRFNDIVWYNEKENKKEHYDIKTFESILLKEDIKNVDPNALKEYLYYLLSEGNLNEKTLLKKFWSKEKLLRFSLYWWVEMEKKNHFISGNSFKESKAVFIKLKNDFRWIAFWWLEKNLEPILESIIKSNFPKEKLEALRKNLKIKRKLDENSNKNYEWLIDGLKTNFWKDKNISFEEILQYFNETEKKLEKESVDLKKSKTAIESTISSLTCSLPELWNGSNKIDINKTFKEILGWFSKKFENKKINEISNNDEIKLVLEGLKNLEKNFCKPELTSLIKIFEEKLKLTENQELVRLNNQKLKMLEQWKKIVSSGNNKIVFSAIISSTSRTKQEWSEMLARLFETEEKKDEIIQDGDFFVKILNNIPWLSQLRKIEDLIWDSEKFKIAISYLEFKKSNETLAENEEKVYEKLTELYIYKIEEQRDKKKLEDNLSEEQLEALEENWLFDSSNFSEKNDLQNPQTETKAEISINKDTEKHSVIYNSSVQKEKIIQNSIDELIPWESSPIYEVWKEKIKVTKNIEGSFKIEEIWWTRIEIVNSSKEVLGNFNLKNFINDTWINFIKKWNYQNILQVILERNWEKFKPNTQLTKPQMIIIMKCIWKMFWEPNDYNKINWEIDEKELIAKINLINADLKANFEKLATKKEYVKNEVFNEQIFKNNILKL